MHTTVRGGKSLMRLGYDQGGGGYQSMPRNEDPGRTNITRDQPEETGDPQRAAALQNGWEQEYAQLFALIEGIPGAVELLDRLVQTSPQEHAAMNGQSAPPGRPSVPTQDTPPPFQGRPRTGARDQFKPMNDPVAVDWRPLIKGPHSTQAIRGFVAQSEMKRRQRETEAVEKRFPDALSRLKRAF